MTVSRARSLGARTRILIVDDHDVIRSSLTELLSQQSALTVCAAVSSAERALDFLLDQPVDLAIVDISLGEMNGLQLTQRLSRDYPHLRVLILSMHDPASHAARALAAGARAFVTKSQAGTTLLTAIGQPQFQRPQHFSRLMCEPLATRGTRPAEPLRSP